jgi:endoglucanase Acf2
MTERKQATITIIGLCAAIVVVAAAAIVLGVSRKAMQDGSLHNDVSLVDQATLNQLPHKNGSSADTERVGSDIIPPTNSWISGMVLQKTPEPVYPMPLSFLAKDTGFEIGLPTVQSTATTITGGHQPGITATVDGATHVSLTRYDKISATLAYADGARQISALTLAEGSPFVYYHGSTDSTIHIAGITSTSDHSSSYLRYTKAGHDYAVATQNGATISVAESTATLNVPKGSFVTFYALPNNGSDKLRAFAANELQSVNVENGRGANNTVQTTFTYKTANNKPTVFVPMAYSQLSGKNASLLTYDSIYGPMHAVSGASFTASVPAVTPLNQLDLSHLSNAHKQQIIASLSSDVAKTSITATDSYYAGKQLARTATLLSIAEQLHQTDAATKLKTILNDAFAKRLNGQYFYYDTMLQGVAAQTKAFGSEDFNDHHFHYGYFIYAASILSKYDHAFLQKSQKFINLLVADIASPTLSSAFPLERNYDPYAAHSWAAGLAPFADGNNQESSSEAINAWNGVALWAQLTHNGQLTSSAEWMLANEAATAKAAWRNVDTSLSYSKDFTSPLTSLNFGGKRTYATFFSDAPNTKLGIQLIPMSPVMLQFASGGASIDKNIRASIHDDNYNVALGDYDLMYFALSNPQKAAELVGKQQDSFIDDGNSRTYLEAWIFSLT